MDVQTWLAVLDGTQCGKLYGGNLRYLKKAKKEKVKQSILEASKTEISPPPNYNIASAQKLSNKSQKKRKATSINPQLLKRICTLP